jgi:hypothetical protein
VDLLNCYYAHSEENALFQRRSYWCAPLLLRPRTPVPCPVASHLSLGARLLVTSRWVPGC